jgi:glycerol-3-phosphate dehydrogenase (NAD(P)+)
MLSRIDPGNGDRGGIVIVGAGAWGTTLATLYAGLRPTRLWCRTREQADDLFRARENRRYLPGIGLPDTLAVECTQDSTLRAEDLVIIAVPSHRVREAVGNLAGIWAGQIIVNCSKGFEHVTMKTLSQVIMEIIPGAPLAVWSGPNLSRELAVGKVARAVLAGRDMAVLSRAARMLRHHQLSFEISRDMRGVELCAALKGIVAVTIGIAGSFICTQRGLKTGFY